VTHKLLARQLKRNLGCKDERELETLLASAQAAAQAPDLPPQVRQLLAGLGGFFSAVGESYTLFDRDLELRTRSLQLSSEELVSAGEKLRAEAARQRLLLEELRASANRLLREEGLPTLDGSLDQSDIQDLSRFVGRLLEERAEARSALLESEKAAREAREQLASAIESLDAGLAMWGADERLVVWNRRFAEMHPFTLPYLRPGATLQEILEGALREMGNRPVDGSDASTWVARQLTELRAAPRVAEQRLAVGWVRIVETRTADGGVVSLRTVIDAQRAAAEQLRKAKEAAEAANRSKSEFLANMSHEIRTPMNGIMGMTQLALGTSPTGEQARYLGLVKKSADNMLHIINDILDFSKIEAGKMELDQIDFSLAEMLEPMLRPLAVRAHEKGLELGVVIAPDVPDGLRGDAGRLRQVLGNLIGNALKFTEQGEVALRIGLLSRAGTSLTLSFSVSDTGIGIPAEKQRSIFDAFAQADASTTRKYGGTGLGLTISSRLVRMMGGGLGVESAAGKGSTFKFSVKLACATEAPKRRAAPAKLQGLRTLVVDDSATNREALTGMLASWGTRVEESPDGLSALAELERAAEELRPYQLAVFDGRMPGLDGHALLDEVRRRPKLRGLQVVFATSDAPESRRPAPAHVQTLVKPILHEELLEALLRALADDSGERPALPGLKAQPAPALPALSILVVEDNEVNQLLMVQLLRKGGHEVCLAKNGREALSQLDERPFDLVLMDVQMPEMDGFEATVELRVRERDRGSPRTKVVALTAHAMRGDEERCLQSGMDGYLTKPIEWDALHAVIARLLPGRVRAAAAPPLSSAQPPAPGPPPAPGQPLATGKLFPGSQSISSGKLLTTRQPLPPAQQQRTEAAPSPRAASGAPGPAAEPLDLVRALRTVDGDQALLAKVAALLARKLPRLLESIRAAEQSGDLHALHANAHSMVGASQNLGAQALADVARALESAAVAGRKTEARTLLGRVAQEVDRAVPALQRLAR
jgi:signal transduction histidine kinase/CheY-like chemotaxis protein